MTKESKLKKIKEEDGIVYFRNDSKETINIPVKVTYNKRMAQEDKLKKIRKKARELGWKGVVNSDTLSDKSFAKTIFGDYVVRWCRERCKRYEDKTVEYNPHFHVGWERCLKSAEESGKSVNYYIDHLDERVTKKWDMQGNAHEVG